ncbi:DUF7553 family protein [Natronosalvus rutilus]|uniref:Uncharacterized protein n=1 Tax=Natronosalvus rutilus TaxID=2953753 RepID=A0A9E7NA41_9EURY|nr:hypothetical protein [Natronosalvus rutilus]UTF53611.1 hypothetical protein NGM29_17880 [Natronosalvus rutilus]
MTTETTHFERAREHLRRASDAADRTVQEQADSIQEGLDEELEGHRTQDEPGPKTDRIAELIETLDGLESEASGEAGERIARAREACIEYQKPVAQDDDET